MKTYIGCKIIEAEPQSDPNHPAEDPMRPRDGYKVVYPDSYVSWSPKDVFEEAYVEVPADDAPALLDDLSERLEWHLGGGRDEDDARLLREAARQARDYRLEVLHAAIKTCGFDPRGYSVEHVTVRADQLLTWIETGARPTDG